MTTPRPAYPAVDGLWTLDVCLGWLESIGVPYRADVPVSIDPKYPKGAVQYALLSTAPGPSGRGIGPEESRARQPGFQLLFRGRPRYDPELEALSLAADRAIWRANEPTWVQSGDGYVRLLRVGWTGSGPQRLAPTVGPGERDVWTCSYYVNVIEEA